MTDKAEVGIKILRISDCGLRNEIIREGRAAE